MKIKFCILWEITPYADNPRHNDAGVDHVAAPTRESGFRSGSRKCPNVAISLTPAQIRVLLDQRQLEDGNPVRDRGTRKIRMEFAALPGCAVKVQARARAFAVARNEPLRR
jgi:hypothetical protein